ncbi:MAG: hypothetical protein HWD90_07930 [Campylobacteraceae bacterium]|nr:hypothetical protein [Campylobacteraceae bacterium]
MKKLFLGLIVIVVILVAPLGVKNFINNTLEEKKDVLNNNGIEFNVLSSNGYFSSHREFEISINDISKFQIFLKDKALEINDIFRPIVESIDITKFRNIETLKSIIFKGEMDNSNINPFSKIKSKMYLASMPKSFEKDRDIKTILDNKTIAFDLVFSFAGKLENIILKDIDYKNKFMLTDTKFDNKTDDNNIAGILNIGKMNLLSSNRNDRMLLDKVNCDFTYKNYFENSTDFFLNSFAINNDIKIDKLDMSTKGSLVGNNYSGNTNISFENTILDLRKNQFIKISNFNLNIDVNDFDSKSLLNFNDLYNQSIVDSFVGYSKKNRINEIMKYQMELEKVLIDFLNHGGEVKADLSFKEFNNAIISLNNPKLDMYFKLDKNNLTLLNANKKILEYLDLEINLKLKKVDYENLLKIFRTRMLDNYVKFENNEALFKVKTINNQINVNGKTIRL